MYKTIIALFIGCLFAGYSGSATADSRNILRNGAFLKQTNKGLPDYWDLHHAAALTFKNLYNQYGIDESEISPVSGARVLKIVNSESGFHHLALMPTKLYFSLPEGIFIFSVYLKAGMPGSNVTICQSWGNKQSASFSLSSEWKRYTALFHITKNDREIQPVLYFNTRSSYFISAPQLEQGDVASRFIPDPDEVLPEISSSVYIQFHKQRMIDLYKTGSIRTNPFHSVLVNNQPYPMIGIMVSAQPQDWYFQDLYNHGFNTIFYLAPMKTAGAYDHATVKNFLDAADRHQLKVIIGLPIAGSKPVDWRSSLDTFCRLVSIFKDNPAVLGWWAFDEPNSLTWSDDELLDIYRAVKKKDPNHLVIGNWDNIPVKVGAEPAGTLTSTDMYSHDYYPFAWVERSIYGFGYKNALVSWTADVKSKPSHVFIQLYGGGDAWREPTGDELNFMTMLALMNGSMVSYYDTKSNSGETWNRLAVINKNTKQLLTSLFLEPCSREINRPVIQGDFIFSVWDNGFTRYVFVLNITKSLSRLGLDVRRFYGDFNARVAMLIGKGPNALKNGFIMDLFQPYEAKVYSIKRHSTVNVVQ